MIYKNYLVYSLCSNALSIKEDFYQEKVDDISSKLTNYNVKEKSEQIDDEKMNYIHQKKNWTMSPILIINLLLIIKVN